MPADWNKPLAEGRLLILSCFPARQNHVTTELATRRNELVAALADDAFIIHATPDGHVAQLNKQLQHWDIRVVRGSPDSASRPETD